MYYCCPKCGAIAEYNAYYGRITCTSCNWESEKKVLIKPTYKPKALKIVSELAWLKSAIGNEDDKAIIENEDEEEE